MIFTPYAVPSPFDLYIESIFHFKDFVPDHSIERVVPTGHSFLIFELDDIPRNTFDNTTLKPNATYRKAWISGMHEHYISISAHEKSEMFVIQFKPYGAFPFLQLPINEINNRVVPGEEILGDDVFAFREGLMSKETSEGKFEVAQTWLEGRFANGDTPDADIITVADSLIKDPLLPFKAIAEAYPKTQKHLISQFKKYCGLTPKIFHRIIRFNEILATIQKEEKISWTQIAYQCGFSDQSHFIKEFRAFSGFNPREFIKQEFHKEEESNFFPLDRKG